MQIQIVARQLTEKAGFERLCSSFALYINNLSGCDQVVKYNFGDDRCRLESGKRNATGSALGIECQRRRIVRSGVADGGTAILIKFAGVVIFRCGMTLCRLMLGLCRFRFNLSIISYVRPVSSQHTTILEQRCTENYGSFDAGNTGRCDAFTKVQSCARIHYLCTWLVSSCLGFS